MASLMGSTYEYEDVVGGAHIVGIPVYNIDIFEAFFCSLKSFLTVDLLLFDSFPR